MSLLPDLSEVPLLERILAKTEFGRCWIYRGATNGRYGKTSESRTRRQLYAHRAMYELAIGPIDEGLLVCHTCDTPLCIRPSHLFLGDQNANMADAARKNRTSRGTNRHSAKLTPSDVRAIRAQVADGQRRADVAAAYAVSHSTIDLIIARKRWADID